jgi:hypothetical protein
MIYERDLIQPAFINLPSFFLCLSVLISFLHHTLFALVLSMLLFFLGGLLCLVCTLMDGIFVKNFFVWFWGVLFQRKKVSSTFGFLFNRGTKIKSKACLWYNRTKKEIFLYVLF